MRNSISEELFHNSLKRANIAPLHNKNYLLDKENYKPVTERSRSRMYFKLGVLKNFEKFHRPEACNFIKRRLQHRCFPVKFSFEIFKNTFFDRTPAVAASTVNILLLLSKVHERAIFNQLSEYMQKNLNKVYCRFYEAHSMPYLSCSKRGSKNLVNLVM